MPPRPDAEALIDTICDLAVELARLCPGAEERAERLVALVGELRATPIDRGAIEDAITSETIASDLSDAQVRTTTDAVVKAARGYED